MSCKIRSLALAVCIVEMAACLGMAAENPKPETVVYLGRSSSFALPTEGDAICGRLLREMLRQSFLVAARDQLGLPTRDASLGDEMPTGGDNAPFDMHTTASKAGEQNFVEVNRGFAKPGPSLMHAIIEFKPRPVDDIHRAKPIWTVDYREFLVAAEKLSRGQCVEAIKQAGFQGKPNVAKESAAVDEAIKQALNKTDFLSQFSAVRQLHELIRTDGESPERIGALVRGYANLGLLTELHWHPAHKAFKARSLIYAQRMAADGKRPWLAGWHRAYAFALAGLHNLAIQDLETAEKQWTAAAKPHGERPTWVDLIDAYCRFDHARLKTEMVEGPRKDLAALLWLDSVTLSNHTATTLGAATETVEHFPDCYPAYDTLCELGGVIVGHMATSRPMTRLGETLYPRVAAMPGLPETVASVARVATRQDESGDESNKEEEFATRAKLIRALLDSDKPAAPRPLMDSPPAKPSAGAVSPERGEPSWVCLGQLISNLSFVHAWRRVYFELLQLGVPTNEFLKSAAPLVEAHPYRLFLATYTLDPRDVKNAWDQVKIPNPDDLEYQAGPMWVTYQALHKPAAAGIKATVESHLDATSRDFVWVVRDELRPDYPRWTALVLQSSPLSPMARATAIEYCGDDYRSRFGEWEKTAGDYPAMAMAFAGRAKKAKRWEEATKWLKPVAEMGDSGAVESLLEIYQLQGKMDLWLATLEESLKAPDYSLRHAEVHARIARYYMHDKKWDEALAHAKLAASSYSNWGLGVAAECYEAMGDLKTAESIFKAMGDRYPPGGLSEWYAFCRRTGYGDPAIPHNTIEKMSGGRTLCGGSECPIMYTLEKNMVKAQWSLNFLLRQGNPIHALHMAILSDETHDNKTRDSILAIFKRTGENYKDGVTRQNYAPVTALAGLIADDLAKGGKGNIDLDAAWRLNPIPPFIDKPGCGVPPDPVIAFDCLLGYYFDVHGKPDLADRCWKRCLTQTQSIADGYRTLAAAKLLSHAAKPKASPSLPKKGDEKPKPAAKPTAPPAAGPAIR